MSLSPGTRLGPYEIVGTIGAGGMGEVYKAQDTRLERVVALKVIQSAFAASKEMRERFEREARAISALDHPNICILYDVSHDADVSFLVMQYLEGETLADRLARAGKPVSDPSRPASGSGETSVATVSRGPIPFDTALRYATEIASALDAAHRRGIVHRDLKPGNVMLTKTGTKLLDFGLAKLAAKDEGVFGGDGATRTSPLTSQGAMLGTLYYMSPEQLEGTHVDARSDIHAFGALLFEVLSGKRAFDGQSQAGIITAIVGGDPPSLTQLSDTRVSLPPVARRALDRLLAKCLAKNPDERWQSAADLADELRWIVDERQRPAADGTPAPVPVEIDRGARKREPLWIAATVLAVVAAAYAWYPRPAPPPPTPVMFTFDPPAGQLFSLGQGLLAVSPDGTRIAFATGSAQVAQLWVRDTRSMETVRLERADGAWNSVWSPDGRAILYTKSLTGVAGAGSALLRLDLAGGAPRTLADRMSGRPAWSSAGLILFELGRKFFTIPENGGTPVQVMAVDEKRGETNLDWPIFLPDGRRYLFILRGSESARPGLYLASLDSADRTFLLDVFSSVEYSHNFLFYQRDGVAMAHPFDADAGRFTGDAVPAVEDVRYNPGNGRAAFSVGTASGALAYVSGSAVNAADDRRIMLFDRAGKTLQQFGGAGRYFTAALAPNGRQAIVVKQDSSQPPVLSLWLLDLERGVLSPFTVGSADERFPVWFPDGSSVAFQSSRDDVRGIYRRMAGGGATTDELLFKGDAAAVPTGFSSDGQQLLFTLGIGAQARIWVLPLGVGCKAVEVFPGTNVSRSAAVFSPNGKWIAYSQCIGPQDCDVYVEPYPANGYRERVSSTGAFQPRWTPDRQLLYRAANNKIMSVDVTEMAGKLRLDAAIELFEKPRPAFAVFAFSPDSRAERFLMVQPPEKAVDSAPVPITVIMNWAQSLKK
jgi:serine/threonine protein kinase/Tol biopolymer transport system component